MAAEVARVVTTDAQCWMAAGGIVVTGRPGRLDKCICMSGHVTKALLIPLSGGTPGSQAARPGEISPPRSDVKTQTGGTLPVE